MSQAIKPLAILFADISGSTALYEQLGDSMARQLVAQCIALMANEIAAHRGTLVKTIGDEIMCAFPDAESAIRAACALQKTVESGGSGDHPMHIRIGVHYGDVISETDDVYGDTVNVAARVTAITRATQIMVTLPVVNALPQDLKNKTHQVMRAEFKGKQGTTDVFQVLWEEDAMMRTRVGMPTYRKPADSAHELTLSYGDRSIKINEQRKNVIIGRIDSCDLSVPSDFASRQHARVELRAGKFFILDQSTNGTYLRFSDGQEARIAREETILRGSGSISLGQAFSENQKMLVEFLVAAITNKSE